ncbi:MAG: 2-phospho-L-lactate/phosphoenolpyruvate guanylyltransferase [Actinomycetota bacterium]|nr:2-phospho-L-lactate/phosphoenolpyruvate guanylyltransferase [Actinomycetota bacterium]
MTGATVRGPGPPGRPAFDVGPLAVLLPVKSFAEAKRRLAPALAPPERARLARAMATSVLLSAVPLPAAVVCDDADVAAWARDLGALVVWEPERGLNRAVEAGVERLGAAGARRVIVAHADLPLARDLRWVGRFAGVTLVPDRRGGGTNAICVPTGAGFTFSYGPGSFARHGAEAHRLGLPLRVVREPSLAADVDVPADLSLVESALATTPGR